MTHFNAFKPHPSAHNPMDFNTLHLPLFSFLSFNLYHTLYIARTRKSVPVYHFIARCGTFPELDLTF